MKTIKILAVSAIIGLLGVGGFIYSGVFNIAADDPHWPVTYKVLTVLRDHSVEARVAELNLPDLDNALSIRLGAGNYDAMCTPCHLSPGMDESELSAGLYPKPPSWREIGEADSREAFWVIKHGIKMSGMPAWGKSMSDPHIWNLVAFVKKLPELTPAAYAELVESSSGHLHESGNIHPHDSVQ